MRNLYTNGNYEESENSSGSFTSSSEETPDNTPKQVRSRISKKKRLKIRALLLSMKKQIEIQPNQSQINGTN